MSLVISKEMRYIRHKGEKGWRQLIKKAVDNDIWFYDTKTRLITANSESVRWAFKMIYESV